MLEQKLTAERKKLSRRYSALRDEVKEVEQIRKGVYSILREETAKSSLRTSKTLNDGKRPRRE